MKLGTRFFFVMAAVASLAGPMAAGTVSYPYVTTNSSIFAGGVADNYDSVTGLYKHPGSCYLQGGGTGPCATLSSDPATNVPGLTAASVDIANGVAFDPQNGISGYADASASANLATGLLRAYVDGPNCSVPNASGCADGGDAAAEMQDALTFHNTTGHTVDIGVTWAFDGTIVPTGTFNSQSLDFLFCLGPGTICAGNANSSVHEPNAGGQAFRFLYSPGNVPTTNALPTTGWVSSSLTPGANAVSETFHGVYAVPSGVSTDSLNAILDVHCLLSTCNFGHTAALTIDPLPSGVDFTSNSGVLLTETVPEPSTWALSLGAVLVLWWRRRRVKTA